MQSENFSSPLVNPLLTFGSNESGLYADSEYYYEDFLHSSELPWYYVNELSTVASPTTPSTNYDDGFVEGWLVLVIGYCFVFTVGVISNVFLIVALCAVGNNRTRALPVRNHILLNLAAADLAVTAICVPISACAIVSHTCWPSYLVSWMCSFGPLLQRTPVAASTLSLALLSLDRWANLRHQRISQKFRQKHFIIISITSIWLLASFVAFPTFFSRQWMADEDQLVEEGRGGGSWDWKGSCIERWTSPGLLYVYKGLYLGTAFVSPALIVAACHASVSKKLTSQLKGFAAEGQSDAGKAHQKPKQVLIVAQEPTNNPNAIKNGAIDIKAPPAFSRKIIPVDPNSDEDDLYLRMQIQADLESFRQISQFHQQQNNSNNKGNHGNKLSRGVRVGNRGDSPVSNNNGDKKNSLTISALPQIHLPVPTSPPLRAIKRESSIIRAHRRLRKKLLANNKKAAVTMIKPPPLLPTYSSQSFRSRRRAANLLAALAFVFVLCWLPYVCFNIWAIFSPDHYLVNLLIPFSLFLGHAHSAINPVVSWRLNRSAFVRFQKIRLFSFLPSRLERCFTCPCDTSTTYEEDNQGDWGGGDSNDGSRRRRKCWPCSFFKTTTTTQEVWNRNSSTNEQALGAFHPRYLNRLAPDPVSKCHTSHFLK